VQIHHKFQKILNFLYEKCGRSHLQNIPYLQNIRNRQPSPIGCGRLLWTAPSSSLFEPNVVLYSLSVIPLQHRSCSVCMSFVSWATTMGRLLGSKVGNSIKCLSQGHSNALQSFATFRLLAWHLYQLSHAAA